LFRLLSAFNGALLGHYAGRRPGRADFPGKLTDHVAFNVA
jgi:hypothetical protein